MSSSAPANAGGVLAAPAAATSASPSTFTSTSSSSASTSPTAAAGASAPPQRIRLSSSATFQRQFAAGGGAGVITKLATAPLERAKVLMQLQGMMGYAHTKTKYTSVLTTLARVTKEEGVSALYKGCGANIVRIAPAYAFKFSLNDQFKRAVARPGQSVQNLSPLQLITAATVAGGAQTFLTYPLESIRQRLYMSDSLGHAGNKGGIPACIKRTLSAEGIRGFYKALPVGLGTGAPFVGVEMSTYELLNQSFTPRHASQAERVSYSFIFGAIAGLFSQSALYPLDTVWRRMMADGMFETETRYTSSWHCVKVTLAEEGFRGLFAGVGANAARAIPAAGIQFMAYDRLKWLFNVGEYD